MSLYILTNSKKDIPAFFSASAKVVKRNSLMGVFYLITSETLLLTHGLNYHFKLLNKKRQLVINLTHGMYLKKMHLMLGDSSAPSFHYILSCSSMHKDILSEMFGVSEDKVLIKGLPRNN